MAGLFILNLSQVGLLSMLTVLNIYSVMQHYNYCPVCGGWHCAASGIPVFPTDLKYTWEGGGSGLLAVRYHHKGLIADPSRQGRANRYRQGP